MLLSLWVITDFMILNSLLIIICDDLSYIFSWVDDKQQNFPCSTFRLCGSNVGNTRRFIAAGNQLHMMFRSEFTVPLNLFTGQPNVQYQLVGVQGSGLCR